MNRAAISTLALSFGLLTACASNELTTPSQENARARAQLDEMMQETGSIGDDGAMGGDMTMRTMPVMEKEPGEDIADVDYAAIISNEARPADDVARDNVRKPSAVLEFAGVTPGMTVYEIEAGGGYFTEILSLAVGDTGTIYMQNPAAFDSYFGGSQPPRLSEGRLDNVEYVKTQFDDLKVEDASVDMVTWMQGPHELWYTPDSAPDGLGEAKAAFAEIARVLKPGGMFIALDHTAPAGSPATTGGETHRIDPALVIGMAKSAGLEMVASSDMFANPDDPMTVTVFDESIRGKTDQFLLKFQKPE